jgi:HEAT repeat protein
LQAAIRARAEEWSAITMLVPALGLVEAPTAASEQTLRELARKTTDEQIRTTVELALGIMARNLWEAQPQRARGILQETLQKLALADSSSERRQQLLVLGNIGAAETFNVIAGHLKDESAPVRAAAAAALRWIESAGAESLLLSALTTDADEQVRLEAAQALGFRAMTAAAFKTHQSALAKDTSASVRLTLLRNIAKAHRSFPQATDVLNQIAQQDAVQEVREEAGRLLEEVR